MRVSLRGGRRPRVNRRRGAKGRNRPAKLGKTQAKAVRKIVKKELHKEAENKMVSLFYTQQHNSSITAGDVYPLVPPIAKGSNSNERIGDVISPRKMLVKFRVIINPTAQFLGNDTWFVPIQARVLLLKQKSIKNSGNYAQVDVAHLLRNNECASITTPGNPAQTQYVGDPFDNMRAINTDLFEVLLDKKILIKPQGFDPTVVDNTEFVATALQPNLFEWTTVVKTPAKLTYDDGNGLTPNNFAPFALIGYNYIDGSVGDVVSRKVQMTTQSYLYYEDM